MRKSDCIDLPTGERINVLYEDRSALAIDKPRGWMLVPFSWQRTDRNLQAALASSIQAGDFWARSRHLKFLRHVHRLDADTTGVLLLAKSPGALEVYSRLFETRRMEKGYLAVVRGTPPQHEWICRLPIGPEPGKPGKMKIDRRHGKPAETRFRIRNSSEGISLVEAEPYTGRTHQIRLHLAATGFPVLGDALYGDTRPDLDAPPGPGSTPPPKRATWLERRSPIRPDRIGVPGQRQEAPAHLALRAVGLRYRDPFTKKWVRIQAPTHEFVVEFGFHEADDPPDA